MLGIVIETCLCSLFEVMESVEKSLKNRGNSIQKFSTNCSKILCIVGTTLVHLYNVGLKQKHILVFHCKDDR